MPIAIIATRGSRVRHCERLSRRGGPGIWVEECYFLAAKHVYTQGVRAQIDEWGQQGDPGELKLDADYLKTMRLTSQQQAALAARRLAHLIESAFVESTKPTNASAERSQ